MKQYRFHKMLMCMAIAFYLWGCQGSDSEAPQVQSKGTEDYSVESHDSNEMDTTSPTSEPLATQVGETTSRAEEKPALVFQLLGDQKPVVFLPNSEELVQQQAALEQRQQFRAHWRQTSPSKLNSTFALNLSIERSEIIQSLPYLELHFCVELLGACHELLVWNQARQTYSPIYYIDQLPAEGSLGVHLRLILNADSVEQLRNQLGEEPTLATIYTTTSQLLSKNRFEVATIQLIELPEEFTESPSVIPSIEKRYVWSVPQESAKGSIELQSWRGEVGEHSNSSSLFERLARTHTEELEQTEVSDAYFLNPPPLKRSSLTRSHSSAIADNSKSRLSRVYSELPTHIRYIPFELDGLTVVISRRATLSREELEARDKIEQNYLQVAQFISKFHTGSTEHGHAVLLDMNDPYLFIAEEEIAMESIRPSELEEGEVDEDAPPAIDMSQYIQYHLSPEEIEQALALYHHHEAKYLELAEQYLQIQRRNGLVGVSFLEDINNDGQLTAQDAQIQITWEDGTQTLLNENLDAIYSSYQNHFSKYIELADHIAKYELIVTQGNTDKYHDRQWQAVVDLFQDPAQAHQFRVLDVSDPANPSVLWQAPQSFPIPIVEKILQEYQNTQSQYNYVYSRMLWRDSEGMAEDKEFEQVLALYEVPTSSKYPEIQPSRVSYIEQTEITEDLATQEDLPEGWCYQYYPTISAYYHVLKEAEGNIFKFANVLAYPLQDKQLPWKFRYFYSDDTWTVCNQPSWTEVTAEAETLADFNDMLNSQKGPGFKIDLAFTTPTGEVREDSSFALPHTTEYTFPESSLLGTLYGGGAARYSNTIEFDYAGITEQLQGYYHQYKPFVQQLEKYDASISNVLAYFTDYDGKFLVMIYEGSWEEEIQQSDGSTTTETQHGEKTILFENPSQHADYFNKFVELGEWELEQRDQVREMFGQASCSHFLIEGVSGWDFSGEEPLVSGEIDLNCPNDQPVAGMLQSNPDLTYFFQVDHENFTILSTTILEGALALKRHALRFKEVLSLTQEYQNIPTAKLQFYFHLGLITYSGESSPSETDYRTEITTLLQSTSDTIHHVPWHTFTFNPDQLNSWLYWTERNYSEYTESAIAEARTDSSVEATDFVFPRFANFPYELDSAFNTVFYYVLKSDGSLQEGSFLFERLLKRIPFENTEDFITLAYSTLNQGAEVTVIPDTDEEGQETGGLRVTLPSGESYTISEEFRHNLDRFAQNVDLSGELGNAVKERIQGLLTGVTQFQQTASQSLGGIKDKIQGLQNNLATLKTGYRFGEVNQDGNPFILPMLEHELMYANYHLNSGAFINIEGGYIGGSLDVPIRLANGAISISLVEINEHYSTQFGALSNIYDRTYDQLSQAAAGIDRAQDAVSSLPNPEQDLGKYLSARGSAAGSLVHSFSNYEALLLETVESKMMEYGIPSTELNHPAVQIYKDWVTSGNVPNAYTGPNSKQGMDVLLGEFQSALTSPNEAAPTVFNTIETGFNEMKQKVDDTNSDITLSNTDISFAKQDTALGDLNQKDTTFSYYDFTRLKSGDDPKVDSEDLQGLPHSDASAVQGLFYPIPAYKQVVAVVPTPLFGMPLLIVAVAAGELSLTWDYKIDSKLEGNVHATAKAFAGGAAEMTIDVFKLLEAVGAPDLKDLRKAIRKFGVDLPSGSVGILGRINLLDNTASLTGSVLPVIGANHLALQPSLVLTNRLSSASGSLEGYVEWEEPRGIKFKLFPPRVKIKWRAKRDTENFLTWPGATLSDGPIYSIPLNPIQLIEW